MGTVIRNLEERARSFRKRARRAVASTPGSHLFREIALVSERLERKHCMQENQLKELLREESRITLDLKSVESSMPRIFTYDQKTRENMKKRLSQLNKDRRRLVREYEKEAAAHHDQLLRLLNQFDTLEGTDE